MLPELLSPAGSFDAALAAFQYGADAVYLGLPRFSARADADNLTPDRLRVLRAYADSFSPAKKIYVTCNTLVQDGELRGVIDVLDQLDDLRPDGIIVQDLGVARIARRHYPRLPLHASTQMAVHNLGGALALRDLGFSRVVLARELSLDEVAEIVRRSGIEIEVFVHGALCYSISGLCLFSSHTSGRSGNRGRCAYCCRESFTAADRTAAACYPFSMRDLALAPILGRVVATGARSLKIEGRMKSPLYVACVTDFYRRKLDGKLSAAEEASLVQDLQTIFSRPWTQLYAERADAAPASIIDPVSIGHRGAPIGVLEALYRDRDGVRWLRFSTRRALEKHDGLQVDHPDGGKPFGCAINQLREAGKPRLLISLPAGAVAEVALPDGEAPPLSRGSKVYCSASQAVRRRYAVQALRESALQAGRPADIEVSLAADGLAVKASTAFVARGDTTAEVRLDEPLASSRQPEQTDAAVRKAFARLGETDWALGTLTLHDPDARYAPPSRLNEARRTVLERLSAAWSVRRATQREAVVSAWGLSAQQEAPLGRLTQHPAWSLKLPALAKAMPRERLSGVETFVLGIGHNPLAELAPSLAAWARAVSPDHIRLALPLWTREREMPALRATLEALAAQGWRDWECGDLSGARLLAELGIAPASADWSLSVLNRASAAEVASLGVRSFVVSSETTQDNIRSLSLGHAEAQAELLVYQHAPLYISETAPCLPQTGSGGPADGCVELQDRKGRLFVTRRIDGRWVTVWERAFCVADAVAGSGCHRYRIDLSYSPADEGNESLIGLLMNGQCPANAHAAHFTREMI